MEQFTTASLLFKDKYRGLPGDLFDARKYFSGTECPDFGPQFCNGNGDGEIYISTAGAEGNRYWQHLSLAGLVKGPIYPGWATSTVPGVDSPLSKAYYGSYFVFPSSSSYGAWFDFRSGHHFYFLGTEGNGTSYFGPIFTANQTREIDTKFDDGHPWEGNIRSVQGVWYLCHNFTSYNNADDLSCVLGKKTGF